MARDYEETHINILKNAKYIFLEKGYARTNLREICSGAGVTVGAFYNHFKDKETLFAALVQPCIDELNRIYCASETACFDQLSSHQIKNVWEISNHTIIEFINNIYAHFDAFRLLLLYSDGTSYHDFVEKLVLVEVKESLRFFEELKNRGFTISDIPENVIHMLTHCYFSSIFECVIHNYTKEEALNSVQYLSSFFSSGWKNILGLNF